MSGKAIFFKDSLRTLLLILAASGVLWLFLKEKLNKNVVLIACTILILFDLVTVNRRYVNAEDFQSARKIDKPFIASEIDKEILKDKSYYRVANYIGDPMNDGGTSYFHKSIGGYHAAKLGRYQELYDYQISKNNIEVLNMLNTKYFMFTDGSQRETVQLNPDSNGNAWFVNDIEIVDDANKEIKVLDSLHTKNKAVIDRRLIADDFKNKYPMIIV